MDYPKRLIEVDLPIKRISAHARREKSIRHGHISTLHIWWARRPLAACRAVICASLWPDPADPTCPQGFRDAAARLITEFARKVYGTTTLHATASRESFGQWEGIVQAQEQGIGFDVHDPAHLNKLRFALLDFIADFANWDNSTVPAYLETARSLTAAAHEALGGEPGTRPLVVDPFAGGGSIPLEALRVGADAFASDLNPVAVLLNKVVLEYIPKYGQRLADEVRKWGAWIKEQAEKELAEFYPKDPDGATPIAYLWARTVLSEAPGQEDIPVEIPLIKSMWIAKKNGRNRAFRWIRNRKGSVKTEVVSRGESKGSQILVRSPLLEIVSPGNSDSMDEGTSAGGRATCPVTGFTMPVESVRRQIMSRNGGSRDSRLLCVVTVRSGSSGRDYRSPNDQDLIAVTKAEKELERRVLGHKGNLPLIPEGQLNHLRGFFNVVLYGISRWGDAFSPRQLLALTTLARLIPKAGELVGASHSGEFATAVQSCLALALGKQADSDSSLCAWRPTTEDIGHTFGRQALPMVWDFVEGNIFSGATRDWLSAVNGALQAISSVDAKIRSGQSVMASAMSHPLANDSAEALFTDPPYYSAVPYADLSDYFYSWLIRALPGRHSDLFTGALTPKAEECVSLAHRAAMYREKNNAWFEARMTDACGEARRILKPSGIGVIVFASKETPAWEALLQAVVDSGWIITAAWPIDTEMGSRLRAKNSAVLASSVHLVCRPRESPDGSLRTNDIGEWRDVLQDLPKRIHEWLPRLAEEGIVGADAIFACLGPALEIFSRYSRVERADGSPVTLREYLEEVWAAVAKKALSLLFKGADASGLEPDARLTAMWLWTLRTDRSGTNGEAVTGDESGDETGADAADEDEEGPAQSPKGAGYALEFDAARKIAQGLGANLDTLKSVVEVKGQTARLRSVSEREAFLFARSSSAMPARRPGRSAEPAAPAPKRGKLKRPAAGQQAFAVDDEGRLSAQPASGRTDRLDVTPEAEVPADWTTAQTVLDRVHQAMLLFAKGRSDALKRFLVDDGIGQEARFWKLAQSLSALYPPGTEEKRWVDGVLARKKGLGL
jgi:adenine-specific DNA methylase